MARSGKSEERRRKEMLRRVEEKSPQERPSLERNFGTNNFNFKLAIASAILIVCLWMPGALNNVRGGELVSPFEIVDLPGKGKGVVARRDIKQGELLIKEAPLITVPPTINSSPTEFIQRKLDVLTPTQRSQYYSLSYVLPGQNITRSLTEAEVALAIFQTNGIQAGKRIGVFPTTARLNHGCSSAFNAVYSWREGEKVLVVHALKYIKAQEELLTTYTDTKRSRAERRHYLKENYDFHCSCSVCSLTEMDQRASDARLTRMNLLYQRLGSWGSGAIDGREAVSIANEIWNLGTQEGYWSERGRLAADAALVAVSHSDRAAASSWAALANKWFAIELGLDSNEATEMHRVVEAPQLHNAWASRQFQTVGYPL